MLPIPSTLWPFWLRLFTAISLTSCLCALCSLLILSSLWRAAPSLPTRAQGAICGAATAGHTRATACAAVLTVLTALTLELK